MATYLEITSASIAAGKPLTTGLLARLRDNPIALYENTAVGAYVASDQTNNTTTLADVSSWTFSVLADTVWRVHYIVKWRPSCDTGTDYRLIWKVYATSLAATPGYAMGVYEYYDVGVAPHYYMISGAVNSEVTYNWDCAWAGMGVPSATVSVIDAVVYVGSAAASLKFAFRSGIVCDTSGPIIYEGSTMLAQEISGTT